MPKETKAKLGDKITVTVKRGKRAVGPQAKRADRRYGPPPIGEDKKPPQVQPLITVHDVTQLFGQKVFRESLGALSLTGVAYHDYAGDFTHTDYFYWNELYYQQNLNGFVGSEADDPELVSLKAICPFNPFPALPDVSEIFIFDEIEVFRLPADPNQANRIIYRLHDRCWMLNKDCAGLGVTLFIGAKSIALGASPDWKLKPQKAEFKESESNSLAMPIAVGTAAWSRGIRDMYSKPGVARPKVTGAPQPIKIAAPGHFYESFDTADSTNYKVTTEPSYSASDASRRFPIGKDQVRVYLVPQLWQYVYDLDGVTMYDFAHTLPFQTNHRYMRYCQAPVMTTTSFGAVDFEDVPYGHSRHVENVTGSPSPEAPLGLHFYHDSQDFLSLPIASPANPRVATTPEQSAFLVHSQRGSAFGRASIAAGRPQWEGNVIASNTDTAEGRLVAAIKIKEQRYYVWRKTPTARTITELYNGLTAPIFLDYRGTLDLYNTDTPGTIPFDELEFPQIESIF